ncbi:hypothetical protein KIW84_075436 [Lathyrus oleraceus]|uniref:Aminotransferase-like plant mobile domain-containing protein n=1 Tax=Pisum sativum TaxID=3888 RepID=A0A9D4VVA3_PEA|nr:hypothetical protein KIW84_075436 [Pisum sativum]
MKCSVVRRRGADGRIPDRTLGRGASSSAVESTGYPGGPYDTSLLVKYEHHVARHLWFGEERCPKKELKVVGHGLKLTSRVPLALPPHMESWVSRSGLSSLQRTNVTEEVVVELAVDYLGVSQGEAQSHVRSCRGSYDLFVQHRAASSWAYATRAYLLMLVGSTIFTDKAFTLVETRYLLLFTDLDRCSGYSWGAAALVTLYRYLGDASMFSCKQLGGYPTRLQCWIHEYFPTVGKRGEN